MIDGRTGAVRSVLQDRPTPRAGVRTDVRLFPDERFVVLTTSTGEIGVWDAATGRRRFAPVETGTKISCAALDPSGTLLAAGGANGDVRVWDFRTGKPVTPVMRHPTFASDLAFSDDGRRLVVLADGVTIVPLAEDRRPVADLETFARIVSAGGEKARFDAAAWAALRRGYAREFAFRNAAPKPVVPQDADETARLQEATREVALRVDDPAGWYDYALASVRVGRWEESLAALDRAGRKGAAAAYLRGTALARAGRPAEALRVFEAARETSPGPFFTGLIAGTSLAADDFAAYAAATEAILATRKDLPPATADRVRSFVALADALAGGRAASRLLAPTVGRLGPTSALPEANEVAWTVSIIPGTLADYGPVLRAFEPLARAKPDWTTLNTLGLLLLRAGRDAEAVAAIEQGLRLNGGRADPTDQFVLGAAFLRQGRRDEARAQLKAAVAGFDAQIAVYAKEDTTRLEALVFRREAAALLATAEAAPRA